jgi:hypothetical protein
MCYFDGTIRELGEVSPAAIALVKHKLLSMESRWNSEAIYFSTDNRTDHIVFKFPDDYPRSHVPASYRSAWADWEHLLGPLIDSVAEVLRLGTYDTAKVMFTRLRARGRIPTHVDENPSSIVPHKIHVPLVTHPDVVFRIADGGYHLEVGQAYEVNNCLPHSVENNSDTDRIHLIFDCFSCVGPLPRSVQ